jgi:hypothetical protein
MNEFFLKNNSVDDVGGGGVEEGLAARDGDDRCVSLIDGLDGVLHGEQVIAFIPVFPDPPTADAVQIAALRGFQHQNHREASPA